MSFRTTLGILLTIALAFGGRARLVHAQAGAPARPQAAPADVRQADRAAIRARIDAFVKAFQAGDAKAVASFWTADGEYHGDDDRTVHGRQALEDGFAAFFKNSPRPQVHLESEALRFVGRDTAIEEGVVTIRRDPAQPAVAADYHACLVRENGTWHFALLSEQTRTEPTLRDLAWLIGDWKSLAGQDAEVRTTYAWSDNQKFIQVRFTIKEKDRTLSGFQVLGKDPATGAIRAWTFEAEGGIGEAVWERDGDHWVAEAAGTLADGSTLVATNILRKINDDTFTWQSIHRMLEDEELPDLAPVKVTRVKAQP